MVRAYSPPSVVVPGSYTVGSLPSASLFPEQLAWASDGIVGGCFMFSNGATWTAQGGPMALGSPNPVAVTLGTAWQATNPAKAALVTLNLSSTASISLLDQTQAIQKAEVYIAPTAAGVTGATGIRVAVPQNVQGGTLVVTLVITQTIAQQVTAFLPAGWFYGLRQITGANYSAVSAFDQSIG